MTRDLAAVLLMVGAMAAVPGAQAGRPAPQAPVRPALPTSSGPAPAPMPGQAAPAPSAPVTTAPSGVGAPRVAGVLPTSEFRIGPEDVLDILVWKNAELTRTVAVRPDGRISVPLLNDIVAAGLTPMELRETLATGYGRFINELEVSVIVREIHSLKVSVVGMVKSPGRYELRSQATVLEALALAGGLTEFAKRDRIAVFRNDGRQWQRYAFDYSNVINDNADQNFVLRAGDIVVVP